MTVNFSKEAVQILEQRYLKKDKQGVVIESPDEMLERVATHIASCEKQPNKWKEKFLEIMNSLEFLPNSPTLMNAGRALGQLSACFVIPIEDDLSAIFEAVKQSALIHKTGGGCFKKDTSIITKNGLTNITECFKNEPVLCYNLKEGRFEWGRVIEKYDIDVSNKKKVRIDFEDDTYIYCTFDHPFRVKINAVEKWVKAIDLTDNMEIISYVKNV